MIRNAIGHRLGQTHLIASIWTQVGIEQHVRAGVHQRHHAHHGIRTLWFTCTTPGIEVRSQSRIVGRAQYGAIGRQHLQTVPVVIGDSALVPRPRWSGGTAMRPGLIPDAGGPAIHHWGRPVYRQPIPGRRCSGAARLRIRAHYGTAPCPAPVRAPDPTVGAGSIHSTGICCANVLRLENECRSSISNRVCCRDTKKSGFHQVKVGFSVSPCSYAMLK